MRTVRSAPPMSSFIRAKLFLLNRASPTLSTSSMRMMSVSRVTVMAKASLEYIPLE